MSKKGCQTCHFLRQKNPFFTYYDKNDKSNSDLALNEIVKLVWYWVYQIPVSIIEKFTTKTRNTIVNWNNLSKDVAVAMFDKRKKMGDPGKIVQIDNSLFQSKRKYNRGRLRNGDIIPNVNDNLSSDTDNIDDHSTQKNYGTRIQGPWIFGMCYKNIDGVIERRFFKVEKRDKANLLPIIQNQIELGSIIYSDQWGAYSTLKDIVHHHETVNHS
ncbi:hypothetical protein AGLY_004790 [Aphis glycines]|uniref:ISXO2-like transposase domain-containing protein n=1 Tax=Aphis glycines TaxID=307491 RepID=A0A6G0TUW8_APHGL|nr:hypothetical protein AGLY_004790 [Aphis glycines]